jgi:uncharacterized NAD(P)/FAD-binding protein YdhS
VPATARAWLRALRAETARVEAGGGLWYQPFDDMRDAEWRMWPNLPALERCRVLRQLRTWYDVQRYCSPPQNEVLVDAALAEGGVRFIAARLQAVSAADEGRSVAVTWKRLGAELPQTQSFDAVINCTGLDALEAL